MVMTLKQHREKAYLTTRELAEKAGITTPTLWRIEHIEELKDRGKSKGKTHPSTMKKIAAALGVHPSEIAEFAQEHNNG
jgi:DNA-binding XRE family transcriptional regulator